MSSENDETPPTEPTAPATKTRFVVLAVLCTLSAVLYLDRVCIAQAAIPMQKELGLSDTELSFVFMSFTLAYCLFEVPTGRWGDRIGPRRVLTRISLWWSAFTALTGACTGFASLVTTRFLFGAGEAGAFPNVARLLSRWFPDDERGRVQGLLLAASQIGGAAAPILADQLIGGIGWRWTFAVFGAVGVVWAVGFWTWFRDDPAKHPQVNDAEAARIGRRTTASDVHTPIPWELVLRNPSIWMLSGIMTFGSFNMYIYFTWLPKYLVSGRGVDASTASVMSSVVLGASACGTLLGGLILDRFAIGRGDWRQRIFGGGAYFLAAGLIAVALLCPAAWPAVLLTAASCMLTMATTSMWWSCAIGVSGKHVGALFGLMNSAGVFGAMISQFLPGWIADWLDRYDYTGRAKWDPIFQINIGVLIVAGIIWATFRFVLVEDEERIANSE
jgi:sugar phosphate permease